MSVIKFNGVDNTLAGHAKAAGINYYTLRARIARGIAPELALEMGAPGNETRGFAYKGHTDSLRGHCARLGINYYTVRARQLRGYTTEEALDMGAPLPKQAKEPKTPKAPKAEKPATAAKAAKGPSKTSLKVEKAERGPKPPKGFKHTIVESTLTPEQAKKAKLEEKVVRAKKTKASE